MHINWTVRCSFLQKTTTTPLIVNMRASDSCLAVENVVRQSYLMTCFLYPSQASSLRRQSATEQTDLSQGKC